MTYTVSVTVTLVDRDYYVVPDKLQAFIAELTGYLNEIPAEYRDSADVSLSGWQVGDDAGTTLTIKYTRPETAEEAAARIKARGLRRG